MSQRQNHYMYVQSSQKQPSQLRAQMSTPTLLHEGHGVLEHLLICEEGSLRLRNPADSFVFFSLDVAVATLPCISAILSESQELLVQMKDCFSENSDDCVIRSGVRHVHVPVDHIASQSC